MALLISEYRKVVTLRFWWALLIGPVVIGLFASAIYAGVADQAEANDVPDEFLTGIASIGLYVSIFMIVIFSALFGAINAGTEYRHKTLTPTFLTSSGRDGVIGAKLLVTAGFGLVYGLLIEVLSVVVMLLFGGDQFELNSTLFKVLLAALLAVVCWTLIGAGVAMLFGSPIAATITLVVWYLIGEWIAAAILAGIGLDTLGLHLPFFSTIGTVAAGQLDGESDWPDFAIAMPTLLLWTALFVGLGWFMTRRRDVT